MSISMSSVPVVGNFSGWAAWRVFRFLAIWSAVLSVPRALDQGQSLSSLDVLQTLSWMWGYASDLWRWLGASTGQW